MKNIKLLVLGAASVGKTSLIHQMLLQSLPSKSSPTLEDAYLATIGYGSSSDSHKLLIFDVAGIERNIDIELLRSYISLSEEFILVYSITDRSSYNLVDNIKKIIDQSKGKKDRPIIVLGNKVDLDNEREVGFDEALVWAKAENIKLFEVTSFERNTLVDFIRFLASQLTGKFTHAHSSTSFKLRLTNSSNLINLNSRSNSQAK